jgi:hypothetical protein
MHGWMAAWVNSEQIMDVWMDGCVDEWMDARVDACVDALMGCVHDGWMDG